MKEILIDEATVKQAIDALESRCGTNAEERGPNGAITNLREALAEQPAQREYWEEQPDGTMIPVDPSEMQPTPVQQEPVAWMNAKRDMTYLHGPYNAGDIPLYTSPPAQRQPLTVHEIAEFVGTHEYGPEQLKWFRLGEAAHGIKEQL